VKELFKFQNTESKIQPNHGPSPMVVPPRYKAFGSSSSHLLLIPELRVHNYSQDLSARNWLDYLPLNHD
jgi:hypothetical protein